VKSRFVVLCGLSNIRFDHFDFFNENSCFFYLPHMKYEKNIGFMSGKMQKNIADLHVLGLFRHKKHDFGEKKI
jgi:hypothetical protein